MISGTQRAEELPLITVIAVKGDDNQMNYYSLNNRRLYVLKQLRDLGLLTDNQVIYMYRMRKLQGPLCRGYSADKLINGHI